MRFAKTISSVCLAAFVGLAAFADEPAAPAQNRDAVLDTIAQINHINWVVNVIKSYNNVIVLEEEYEKISPGNLYLDRIPDEETLGRITKMLDTLYSLRKDDRQMKKWRIDFRESRDRKIRDHKHKATKEAVDTITGQVKECCSLWDWATNPLGTLANIAGTVFNAAHYSVGLYNDYDNFIYELDKTAKDKQFDFDTEKMDLLHNQNKELLEDQWQFISRNKLDDRLRVTETDIKMLLNSLKNDNSAWIFTRLYPMRERFSLFPEYWYYLSCAAMETGHFKEGLEACDTFFKVNRGLFRDDPMTGTVAFNKAFMLPKTKENRPEVRRCLELAWTKNANVTHPDWQLDYLAAIMYKGVFDEKDKAEMMFEHAIALIEQESRERTRYGGKAGVTLDEGLRNCRNALHQLRGEPIEEVKVDDKPQVVPRENKQQGSDDYEMVADADVESFVRRLFDPEYGGGVFVVGDNSSDSWLLLPVSKIPDLSSKFSIKGRTIEVSIFSGKCTSYDRLLKEKHRKTWKEQGIVAYTFESCWSRADNQSFHMCYNTNMIIYLKRLDAGYASIQYLPDKASEVALKIYDLIPEYVKSRSPAVQSFEITSVRIGNRMYKKEDYTAK